MGRSRASYAKHRPTAPGITDELKKRMYCIDTRTEGKHTITRADLNPLITFGIDLTVKHLLSKEFILGILTSYATLHGDLGVQVFLKQNPTWINDAMVVAAMAVYDA